MEVATAVGSISPVGFGLIGAVIVGVVALAVWVILASSRFVQGGTVERPERVPQLYGYTVCLIALCWALTSAVTIVEKSLALSNPEYDTGSPYGMMGPSVSSFESFRISYEQTRRYGMFDPRSTPPDTLSEPELRRRYDAIRADRLQRNTVDAKRALVVSTLSLLVAIALFFWHWRWVRRVTGASTLGSTVRIDI